MTTPSKTRQNGTILIRRQIVEGVVENKHNFSLINGVDSLRFNLSIHTSESQWKSLTLSSTDV